MTLARWLRRTSDALRAGPRAAAPRGELARMVDLCEGEGPLDGALPAMRDELTAALEFPWLSQFALAQSEPVASAEATAFVSRFAGSALGEAIGDAMRDVPDSEPARRLRALALSPGR